MNITPEYLAKEILLLICLYGRQWVENMVENEPVELMNMILDPTLRPMLEGGWSFG